MRKGDMLPPVLELVASPRIREDRTVQEFRQKSEKMHRATLRRRPHKHDLTVAEVSLHNLQGKEAQKLISMRCSTCQCSILFDNMGSFNKKSEFRKAENLDKPISSSEEFNITNDPHLSFLTKNWGKTTRM